MKNEIRNFCNRCFKSYYKDGYDSIEYYILEDREFGRKIIDGLFKCIQFEHPDGYFYDKNVNTVYIYEHFSIDCSPTKKGSSRLRQSSSMVNKKENKYIENTEKDDTIESVVEQGYCKDNVYYVGADGDKYRDNYLNNFIRLFNEHSSQIEKYKIDCCKNLGFEPKKYIICFVIEDYTLFGTRFKEDKKIGDFVNPLVTKNFAEILLNSDIDAFIFNSVENPKMLTVLTKNSLKKINLDSLIDLKDKEFYIIPAAVKFTGFSKIKE